MIPTPNLDDRSFEDIVEEAIRLIPQYCPQWTNFNKSDPGITLLELFAWMTEMVLYRLNQVPEKNYLAFLNMMGVKLQPPQPARSLVHFEISEKADQIRIPAGTGISTSPAGDEEPIVFETESDLFAIKNRLVKCMSQFEQTFSDSTPFIEGTRGPFEVFGGGRTIERFIYLGDERLGAFTENSILFLRFEAQGAGEREFPSLLEWEYWDGSRWRELVRPSTGLERNTVAFQGPASFEACEVNEVETYWVRGRLFEVPQAADETLIDTVSARLEVMGEGVLPDLAFCNMEGDVYQSLDLDKNFMPLGKSPGIDSTLYLSCEEVLAQSNTNVQMEVVLSDQSVADAARPSHALCLRWEYYNGKRWKILGKVKWSDDKIATDHDLKDETKCFTTAGILSFFRPSDLKRIDVNGHEAHWIRCRIEFGNYGAPGTYELDGDTWVWKDENPLLPPSLKGLSFKFQEESQPLTRCFVYNDFVYSDFSKIAATEYKPFQAFDPVAEESPTLFLGWEGAFPADACSIYFNVVGHENRGGRDALPSFDKRDSDYVEQRVVWEYWQGKSWAPLAPEDSTDNFTKSGFIRFSGPSDFRKSRRFGESLYWMRSRLEMGGYDEAPRISHILLNAVEALNLTSYHETLLGYSLGLPNQKYYFPRGPVLDSEQIYVREKHKPEGESLEALLEMWGEAALLEDSDGEGVWIRWARVDGFFDQSSVDRVYTKDISSGEVVFGDGNHGMIPPKGNKNIKAVRYQVGGGNTGNVPANSITEPLQNLSFVDGATNPFPAAGGCDLETVENAKLRAPHMLKARNRAVTADDFEWLAMEASNSVARVKCLPASSREGEVSVIVLPKTPLQSSLDEKPVPTNELLKRVRNYLDGRKLVTAVVNVVRPSYVEMSLEVEIVRLHTGAIDRIRKEVERALRRFLHPLSGGRNGKGWPFGRAILKVDLYQVIENVDGVDFVDKIRLRDEDRALDVEQIRLRDDQLVHVVDVNVVEKAHERIV
jgi:hypothetical protein